MYCVRYNEVFVIYIEVCNFGGTEKYFLKTGYCNSRVFTGLGIIIYEQLYTGYYMVARRYEFYVVVARIIYCSCHDNKVETRRWSRQFSKCWVINNGN